MREIKFRGKSLRTGKWVYGSLVRYGDGRVEIYTPINPRDENSLRAWLEEVDPATVGQYTGLKDKNGKEIYEGDIVRYTFDNPDSVLATENGLKVRTDKIFWQEWRASFAIGCELTNNDLFRYVRNGNRVEVIGNIHDNPELLEVG